MRNYPRRSVFNFENLFPVFFILFVLGVLSFMGLGIYVTVGGGATTVRSHAETYARQYTRDFYAWENPVVQCFGLDTDNNGYVTCTVSRSAGETPRQIECAANLFTEFNTGCRQPQLRTLDVNATQQQ